MARRAQQRKNNVGKLTPSRGGCGGGNIEEYQYVYNKADESALPEQENASAARPHQLSSGQHRSTGAAPAVLGPRRAHAPPDHGTLFI